MKVKKRTIVIGSLLLLIFIILFFLSSLVNNYINKNGEDLLGRKVELGNLNFNYFKVSVRASDLIVFEANNVDTFAGFKELYINFDPWKLVRNEYSFSTITLDSLYAYIIQDGNNFNFSDLIPPEDTLVTEVPDTTDNNDLRFSIYNIVLSRGKVDFYDKQIDNRLVFDDLDLNLPKIAWDSEQSEVGAEFEFGEKGIVSLGADVNHQLKRYTVFVRMDNMQLEPISNYVEEYINVDGLSGWFNGEVNLNGHMENTTDIVVSGIAQVDTFRLWESNNSDLLSWKTAMVRFDSLDLGHSSFNFSKIEVVDPVLTASLNKDMSNIERVFLPLMETDSTVVEPEMDNEVDSIQLSYSVDSIILKGAQVLFTDNTLNRPFKYDLKDIDVSLSGISEKATSVPVKFQVNLNDQGSFKGESQFNVLDPYDVMLKAQVEKLRLMSFSPYTEYYITRPITKGDFNYDLSIEMTKDEMLNENKLTIKELEFGDKTKDTTGLKAPIQLGLYLMKDPNDVINIDLSVNGNPSDPEFSVSKIIWKAFLNLLVKTAASPFNALGKLVSTHPEELETLPFAYAQDSLAASQKATLDKIAIILSKKPDLMFTFSQHTYVDVEKDSLSVRIAKKQMLIDQINPKTDKDFARYHQRIEELSNADPSFLRFINKYVEGADTLTLSKACRILVGEDELDEAFSKLLSDRSLLVQDYLIHQLKVDSTSVEVIISDLRNIPEELKSPKFDIEVSIK